MTGMPVGVKHSNSTELAALGQCVLEIWWESIINVKDNYGWDVLLMSVERYLVQDTPPLHMDLLHKITGTGAGEKSSGFMPGARAVVPLLIRKTTLFSTMCNKESGWVRDMMDTPCRPPESILGAWELFVHLPRMPMITVISKTSLS
jgi:hypothetical protein